MSWQPKYTITNKLIVTMRRIGETIRRGVKSGQLADCEPEHVAAALTAVIEGLLLQAIADPEYDPLAAWPTTWRLLTHGLVRVNS